MSERVPVQNAGDRRRFYVLDGYRGIAALVVVMYHYLGSAHYPFLTNSYIAVDLFFVLSGFVIYHSYAPRIRDGMTPGRFINLRIARLAPTVAIGVLLGAAVTLVYYDAIGQQVDLGRFALVHAGHLVFLPRLIDFHVPETGIHELFPTNGPLWSIFFEFVASVCFIWFARFSKQWLWIGSLLSFAILLGGCYYITLTTGRTLGPGVGFAPDHFLLGFPRVFASFLMGMLIYVLTQAEQAGRAPTHRWLQGPVPTLVAYALIFAALLFPYAFSGTYPFLAILVIFPAFIAVAGRIESKVRWLNALSDYLGQLSFPLYCVHEPARLLVRTFFSDQDWSIQLGLAFGLATGVSALVLWLFERIRIRQRLSGALKPITG